MRILITGGTSRLGAALVRLLCEQGHEVNFTFFSSKDSAHRLQEETGATPWALNLGTMNRSEAAGLYHSVGAGIDVLINNSSTFAYDKPTELSEALLDECYRVNLRAPTLLLEEFSKQAGTHSNNAKIVVNILDSKINALNPDYASYTVMKSGLATVTKIYAMQLEGAGVKVYGVAPAMFAESGPKTVGKVSELSSINPLQYQVTTQDVVGAVVFLLKGKAQSGEIITVDAGQSFMNLKRDVAFLDEEVK